MDSFEMLCCDTTVENLECGKHKRPCLFVPAPSPWLPAACCGRPRWYQLRAPVAPETVDTDDIGRHTMVTRAVEVGLVAAHTADHHFGPFLK